MSSISSMDMSGSDSNSSSSGSDEEIDIPRQVFTLVLLFILLAGMASGVDIVLFRSLFRKPKPIIVGLSCQFFILPALAYSSVRIFDVSEVVSVALLSTCMSPGGAFSNWFCALFNADLALSIAMTTVSTVMALAVLPLNMYLYIEVFYDSTVHLDWPALVISVASAAGGLVTGLVISAKKPSWRPWCSRAATVAGVILVVFGAIASSTKAPLWDRSGLFYLQVIFPCMAGLACAHCLARIAGVPPPQAVAIAVECGYQNTGIAMSIVLATFKGDTQGEALGVPLFYGLTQCLLLLPYCAVMWKLGSTHAPSSESFIKAVRGNYQPMEVAEAQLGDDSMASLERMSSLGETKEHRLPTPRDRSLCENDSVLKALLKADRQDTFDPLPEPTEMGAVPVLQ